METVSNVFATTLTNEALYQRLLALEKEIELRAKAAESALEAANEANDHRLETMNNFRADLEKQARNFMTKADYDNQHKALEDKIEAYERMAAQRLTLLEQQSYELKGRQGLSTPLIVVMAGSVGAVLGFLIQLLYRTMSHMTIQGG